MSDDLGAMRYWNPKLQQIDEYLQLVRISENAATPGLKAGFWQVLRIKPGVPAVPVLTVEHDDGSFREPDSGMLSQLEKWDMTDDRVIADRARRDAQLKRDRAHEKAEFRGELVDDIKTTYKARNLPGVRFGGEKWSRDPKARRK